MCIFPSWPLITWTASVSCWGGAPFPLHLTGRTVACTSAASVVSVTTARDSWLVSACLIHHRLLPVFPPLHPPPLALPIRIRVPPYGYQLIHTSRGVLYHRFSGLWPQCHRLIGTWRWNLATCLLLRVVVLKTKICVVCRTSTHPSATGIRRCTTWLSRKQANREGVGYVHLSSHLFLSYLWWYLKQWHTHFWAVDFWGQSVASL